MSNDPLMSSSLSVCLSIFPLEKRQISLPSNGSKKPALHADWMCNLNFLTYCSPNGKEIEFMASEQFGQRLDSMISDVESLLRLPHHKFWSQVVFDSTFKVFLKSFLTNFAKCWEQDTEVNEEVAKKQTVLKQKVFLACLRLSTYKESNDGFMSPEYFGRLHCQSKWFDAIEMSNFCSIYYQQSPLLSKLCENIIKQNESDFRARFQMYSEGIIKTMNSVKRACGLTIIDMSELSLELNPTAGLDLFTIYKLSSLCLDLTSNLYAFADSVPKVVEFLFYDPGNILDRLLEFVENVLKALTWTVLQVEDVEIRSGLMQNLKISASNVISLIKLVIENFLLSSLSKDSWLDCVEFLTKLFEQNWTRNCFDIDTTLHDSIAQLTIFSSKKENKGKLDMSTFMVLENKLNDDLPVFQMPSSQSGSDPQTSTSYNVSDINGSDNKMKEAVLQVKEIISHVDDLIIEYYLERRNLSIDLTINDLFENNCNLPEGITLSDLRKSKQETEEGLKGDRNKPGTKSKADFSSDMKNDIVSKYGFVNDFDADTEFESHQATSANARNVLIADIRDAENVNEFEYEDEYDDTYDNSVRVADSFENREIGFQVQNPNWGTSSWKTGVGAKVADWQVEDDENDDDENQEQPEPNQANGYPNQPNRVGAFRGNSNQNSDGQKFESSKSRSKYGRKFEPQSGVDSQSPSRESFANQPKSKKSHRHTGGGILDDEVGQNDGGGGRVERHPPEHINNENRNTSGGARPKQRTSQANRGFYDSSGGGSSHWDSGNRKEFHRNAKGRNDNQESGRGRVNTLERNTELL